jgi:hypothetical protein
MDKEIIPNRSPLGIRLADPYPKLGFIPRTVAQKEANFLYNNRI